jgi:hypothetical protein
VRWLNVCSLLALAGCPNGDGDSCDPDGQEIASAHEGLATLVGDADALYFLDWDDTDPDTGRGVTLVTRLEKALGQGDVLVRSNAEGANALDRIAVDDTHVYYLDHCVPDVPTCARLFRVGKTGGEPELLVEDRVVDFALRADEIVYATSNENGLREPTPNGSLWSVAKAGGEPRELLSGLYHLRDVEVDDGDVYFTDTADGEPGPWRLGRVGAATPMTTFPFRDASLAIVAQDGDYLYLPGGFRVMRAPKRGGELEPLTAQRAHGLSAAVLFDGTFYATDPGVRWIAVDGSQQYSCGSVAKAPVGGGSFDVLARETEEANSISVDDDFVYWSSRRGAVYRIQR